MSRQVGTGGLLEWSSKGLQGHEVLQQLGREEAVVAVFPLTSVLFEIMGLSGLFPAMVLNNSEETSDKKNIHHTTFPSDCNKI